MQSTREPHQTDDDNHSVTAPPFFPPPWMSQPQQQSQTTPLEEHRICLTFRHKQKSEIISSCFTRCFRVGPSPFRVSPGPWKGVARGRGFGNWLHQELIFFSCLVLAIQILDPATKNPGQRPCRKSHHLPRTDASHQRFLPLLWDPGNHG